MPTALTPTGWSNDGWGSDPWGGYPGGVMVDGVATSFLLEGVGLSLVVGPSGFEFSFDAQNISITPVQLSGLSFSIGYGPPVYGIQVPIQGQSFNFLVNSALFQWADVIDASANTWEPVNPSGLPRY